MKAILKTIMGLFVSLLTLTAGGSYERNDAEITAFANTMVNVIPGDVFNALDAYFQYNPTLIPLNPGGVYASLEMSPLPGQKGNLDPSLTLLRLAPTMNYAVAMAQYAYMKEVINQSITDAYKRSIAAADIRYNEISDDFDQSLNSFSQQKQNLITTINFAVASLNSLKQALQHRSEDLTDTNQAMKYLADVLTSLEA